MLQFASAVDARITSRNNSSNDRSVSRSTSFDGQHKAAIVDVNVSDDESAPETDDREEADNSEDDGVEAVNSPKTKLKKEYTVSPAVFPRRDSTALNIRVTSSSNGPKRGQTQDAEAGCCESICCEAVQPPTSQPHSSPLRSPSSLEIEPELAMSPPVHDKENVNPRSCFESWCCETT